MEQWQAAEDANILDAWTNGGRYNGKRVTDKDIIRYYRKRRDSYDKEDPEWTEWDNELWQMRFQISNERVMMNYKLGKIGEMAVANHLKTWARKMPKNSSYYRNLMASAGDFIKAASAGGSSGGSSFDHEAMMNRINQHQADANRAMNVFTAIDYWMQSRGYLQPGQSVMDEGAINFFEADDLNLMLDGINTEGYSDVLEGIRTWLPGFKGELTWDRIKEARLAANKSLKAIIAEYKKAPYDTHSYQVGIRQQIAANNRWLMLDTTMSAREKVGEAFSTWNEIHSLSTDPFSYLEGDKDMLAALYAAQKQFNRIGDFESAAATNTLIAIVEGNAEGLQGVDFSSPLLAGITGSPEGAYQMAAKQQAMMNSGELLKSGQAIIVPGVATTDTQNSMGYTMDPGWKVEPMPINPNTGRPGYTDPRYIVMDQQVSDGSGGTFFVPKRIEGMPIQMGNLTLGFRYEVDGHYLWGIPDSAQPTGWRFTRIDAFTNNADFTMTEQGGTLNVTPRTDVANTNLASGAYFTGRFSSVTEFLDGLLGQLPANATKEQRDERERITAAGELLNDRLQSGGEVSLFGTAPTKDIETSQELTAFMDDLLQQVPIWAPGQTEQVGQFGSVVGYLPEVDSEEARIAYVRNAARKQWGADAVPYDPAVDGRFYDTAGNLIPRITEQDRALQAQYPESNAIAEKQAAIAAYTPPTAPAAAPVATVEDQTTPPTPTAVPEPPTMTAALRSLQKDVVDYETGYMTPGLPAYIQKGVMLLTEGASAPSPILGDSLMDPDAWTPEGQAKLQQRMTLDLMNAPSEQAGAYIQQAWSDNAIFGDMAPWARSVGARGGNALTTIEAGALSGFVAQREGTVSAIRSDFAEATGYSPRAIVPDEAKVKPFFSAPTYDPTTGNVITTTDARASEVSPRVPEIVTSTPKLQPTMKVAANLAGLSAIGGSVKAQPQQVKVAGLPQASPIPSVGVPNMNIAPVNVAPVNVAPGGGVAGVTANATMPQVGGWGRAPEIRAEGTPYR
jgi:hypothetical protein